MGYQSSLNIAHNCNLGEVVWFKTIVDDVAGNRSETSWWVKRKEPWQVPTLYTYVDHSNQSRNYYIDLHGQKITSISFNTNVNIVMGICNMDGQNLSNYFSGTSFSWTGDKIGTSLVIDCACSNSGWRPDPRTFFSSILINGKGINITAW